ncbi:unnamed protein product, partial [Effrenium voratum]
MQLDRPLYGLVASCPAILQAASFPPSHLCTSSHPIPVPAQRTISAAAMERFCCARRAKARRGLLKSQPTSLPESSSCLRKDALGNKLAPLEAALSSSGGDGGDFDALGNLAPSEDALGNLAPLEATAAISCSTSARNEWRCSTFARSEWRPVEAGGVKGSQG